MKKQLKAVPKFSSEDEERRFWEQNDSSDYLDWGEAKEVVMPDLRPTTKTISIRLPPTSVRFYKSSSSCT